MKLKKITSIKVVPTSPFYFDATFYKPDHFTSGDNFWQKGIRWQTWLWQNNTLGLKFINSGSVKRPQIIIEIYYTHKLPQLFLDSLTDEIKFRYNLELNLSDFYKKFENDKVLKPIIKRFIGMRPGHPSSLYEYLIIGIVLQNATVRRSIQMFKTLLEKYGTKLEFDGKTLWCFWKPGRLKDVTEDEIRKLKVGYRAKYIKKIDDYFDSGEID